MRLPKSSSACALAVALLAGCGSGEPVGPFAEPVVLDIALGESSRDIAEALEARGIIPSKWSFLWKRAWNRKTTLMAGEYMFRQPVRASEAFEMIASGRVRLYRLTLPEGLNRFEITKVVAESSLVSADAFLDLTVDPAPVRDLFPQAETLEGFLFPETYSLARTSTAKDLVGAMISRFTEAMQEARAQSTVEIEDWNALILASMIEEETRGRAERALVSSVFHNRMRRGMLMQCDPTIAYGLILENRYSGRILRADLSDAHPYNTYIHGGLPPGPISNPSKEALMAAFKPAESDYLYFVAKPGVQVGHVFSKTLGAHNRAVRDLRRYQRSVRRRM